MAVRDAGLREAGRPGVVTYSRKVFIPLTRLCRDRCHYCTFATVPHRLPGAFLERDEVLAIAREGAAQGCKEALFTLGDRPEERWPAARQWLDERGYDSTLDYVRACAIAVLEETGLLPHLNPGVLSWAELQRLKPVAPSMGMMLETTATRLWSEPGGPHYGSPDKEPAVRLRVLDDAGRVGVPFTTGILIGIGENRAERADALFAIRRSAREYGHIQEVIIQNFRAKPDTAMRGMPDAELRELAATVAVARLVLGPRARLQAPPNLIDAEFEPAAARRHRRLGRGVPGDARPRQPGASLAAGRAAPAADAAGRLRAARAPDDLPGVRAAAARRGSTRGWPPHVARAGRPGDGPGGRGCDAGGPAVAGAGRGVPAGGRTDLHATIDTDGRTDDRRGDFDSVYGDWAEVAAHVTRPPGTARAGGRRRRSAALKLAAEDPAALLEPRHETKALALFNADGSALDELARIADDLRRDVVGDDVTYVVNRNINFSNVCYVGCRFCAFAQRERDADAYRLSVEQVADRAEEAWSDGATEVCMQGGIDPKLPGDRCTRTWSGRSRRGCRGCTCTRSRRWRSSPRRPRRACPCGSG